MNRVKPINHLFSALLGIAPFLPLSMMSAQDTFSLNSGVKSLEAINGHPENGDFLYVTAGSTLYSIGDQNGNFPETGFHVEGEMGGIWQHPIKLLDGFALSYRNSGSEKWTNLAKSERFTAYPLANQFRYDGGKEISVERTDFVTDSLPVLVVEYRIGNRSSKEKNLDLRFAVDSDLRPVWLGDKNGMIDGPDIRMDTKAKNTLMLKDSGNTWFAGVALEEKVGIQKSTTNQLKGKGLRTPVLVSNIKILPNGQKIIRMYIGGSSKNSAEVERNLTYAKENIAKLFAKKKERYAKIDAVAKITLPDTLLMKAYRWGKYNTDWLIRDVPDMGRGINAGLPDYPWFFSNDQALTFKALVGTRDPQLFYDSWKMMKSISDEFNAGSGQIIHEVSTNGAVYDGGRMEESQLFFGAAWEIFKWYGDKEFLRTYYKHGKKTWEFLQKNDTDNDLYVEGYGGIEIEGLNDEMLDVAVETCAFLENMSHAAAVLGEADNEKIYAEKAATLRGKINADWWSPSENRYADFIASDEKAIALIDMALEKRVKEDRNAWAKKKLLGLKEQIQSGKYSEKGYTVFYNASTLAPLREGIADSVKAEKLLEGMDYFTNKFGLYIAGIARPDDITSEEGSVAQRLKGDFNYNEAIMIAGTAPLAIAETKYRGIDKGMKYIDQIKNNFSFATPGTMYEVSPDYGMFVQAWNVSGINIPLIHNIFGVDPFAYEKRLTIAPDMPSDWNFAKLENLMVGDNLISIDYTKNGKNKEFTITSEKGDWNINFRVPKATKNVKVNGKEQKLGANGIALIGEKNKIEIQE